MFAFLVNTIGALIVFIYMIIAVRADPHAAGDASARAVPEPALKMWFFPWASYAAIAGMMAVLVAMAVTPARAKELYVSLLALAVVSVAFMLVNKKTSSV